MYFLHIFMLFYTLFLMSVKRHLFHFAKNVQKCEKCPKYPHIWGGTPPPPNTPKKVYVRYPHTPSKRPFWGCFRGILKHTKSQFNCFLPVFRQYSFFDVFLGVFVIIGKICEIHVYGPLELQQRMAYFVLRKQCYFL